MSRTESLEVERKYDVGDLVRVPDLAGVGPVDSVETAEPLDLRAVYFDTVEHTLLASRITLRRREGGHDEGWHVKLPASAGDPGARRELHAPLGADSAEPVPDSLRRTIEAVLRGRPVHPVLVLETKRTATRMLGQDAEFLAELADDEVTASNPATAAVRTWREWEVELAPDIARTDGEALQDSVAEALEAAGASVSASKSKLARGLGDSLPAAVALAPAEIEEGTAAEFVTATTAGLASDLLGLDPATREGDQEAVHRFRTTVRRLRSVLHVYRGVVADDDAAWLDVALASLGRTSGVSRDLDVRRELLDHYASAAPHGFVPQEAVGRLGAAIRESAREADRDLANALDEPGYFELLDRLDALRVTEPMGESAFDDRDEFVRESLLREAKRARKRVRSATSALGAHGAITMESLHSARKATRRLRYGLEAAKWAGIKGTGNARKTAHSLHDLLGDALDAGALTDWVQKAAERARWAQEETFGYGVIATLAAADHRDSLSRLKKAAKKL